jgi:broad specificity phosphatase PhoE
MLVLVRHGRTAANADGRLIGRRDVPLDPLGRRQAVAVAEFLARWDRPIGRIVSSPLARARETAEPIVDAVGVPLDVDERWIELDYGELDGLTSDEVPAGTWERWRGDPTFAAPGGESLADLGQRIAAACEEASIATDDADTVVVSHVSPIKAAASWALGVGVEISWRTWVAPGSVTTIAVSARGPMLRSFNETGHLGFTS